MFDDYGVLIVGTLAPFCPVDPQMKAANDDFSDYSLMPTVYAQRHSGEDGEEGIRHPTIQLA